MPVRPEAFGACVLVLLLAAAAGCSSAAIGEISYGNGTVTVPVTSTGDPCDALVQLTVYEVRDFHQQEMTTIQQPVTLEQGENCVQVPVALGPGSYKIYIYVLKPGERQTATIRDIII